MEYDLCRWMEDLDDDLLIGNVNLPGTHDSAAINKYSYTPYACQGLTITQQLQGGIRLLDARIKIKKKGGVFDLVMCHGDFHITPVFDNEYQSLLSFYDECWQFIKENPSEFLIISWKIDDWNGYHSEWQEVYSYLDALFGRNCYPYFNRNITVGQARGRILVLNRLVEDSYFGPCWTWNNNTPGEDIHIGLRCAIYVQDKYDNSREAEPEKVKYDLVIKALQKKTPKNILLNYASGFKTYYRGVYITEHIINYLGSFEVENRPELLGWMLFDYGLWEYESVIPNEKIKMEDIIIDSNFCYPKFQTKFKVKV